MRKTLASCLLLLVSLSAASAFKVDSQRELGKGEAKNQNVVVKCTTATGAVSAQTCHMRRYAKCSGKNCNGWQEWKDLRNPGKSYGDWRAAAAECCAAQGMRYRRAAPFPWMCHAGRKNPSALDGFLSANYEWALDRRLSAQARYKSSCRGMEAE
jgi:hypothetical protein